MFEKPWLIQPGYQDIGIRKFDFLPKTQFFLPLKRFERFLTVPRELHPLPIYKYKIIDKLPVLPVEKNFEFKKK